MSVVITDEQAVLVDCAGVDNLSVAASFGTLVPTLDNPQFANAYMNPANPAQVVVVPIAPPAGSPDVRTVNLSVEDTTNNIGTAQPLSITINPAAESSIALSPNVVALSSAPPPASASGGSGA